MPVYLDHNATTPLDPRVLEAMMPYFTEHQGNPSSVHRHGRTVRAALDRAREQVADLVNAHPSQVIFTGSGTEANNLAIKGFAAACEPGRILIGATEHPSVAAPAQSLKKAGWQIEVSPVDREGRLIASEIESALKSRPYMVSIMWANNETGVLQDIPRVCHEARAVGAVIHTDAVQAAGKVEIDFSASGAHLMSLSAHKINGPKGVGALIAEKSVDLTPLSQGGGQEKDRRSGTENVAGIVGFGAAAALAKDRLQDHSERLRQLRVRLESELFALGDIEIFGQQAERLPNTVCLGVRRVDGETLLLHLDRMGIAVSSGSACASTHREPSPVLLAMGIDSEKAQSAIRVSLGAGNTEQDVDIFVASLAKQLQQYRRAVS